MAILNGYNGRVTFNGTVFHAVRWTANVRVAPVDVTNFVYFGSAAFAGSLKEGELSFDCVYDTVENPFAGSVDLSPGTFGSCVLTLDTTGGTSAAWTFPSIVVLSVRHTHMIRDVSRFTATARVSVFNEDDVPTLPTA